MPIMLAISTYRQYSTIKINIKLKKEIQSNFIRYDQVKQDQQKNCRYQK